MGRYTAEPNAAEGPKIVSDNKIRISFYFRMSINGFKL